MNNVGGPVFVSIGDPEKLQKFLDLNPDVPQNAVFVDDYNFEAYNSAGFGSFSVNGDDSIQGVKLRKPDIGLRAWWNYLTNLISLSPIDKSKPGIPEGVLRLGGTFVTRGDDVIYQWCDEIPGDYPEPSDVMDFIAQSSPQEPVPTLL